jgi:Tol biopolymer transport system component
MPRFIVGLVVALCLSTIAARADSNLKQWQLWKIGADGAGLARAIDLPGYSCGAPAWSHDSHSIAFDAWAIEKSFDTSQIAVVPADGSKPPKFIGSGGMPTWSPDDKRIACHTYQSEIVVMNADGKDRQTILHHWGSPRWFPHGNRIASVLDDNIAIFDLDSKKEQTILPEGSSTKQGFSISPDGERFCFSNNDTGLFLATLGEQSMKAEVRKIVDAGKVSNCSWAPDGKRIVFSWIGPRAKSQLYIIDVDSGKPPKWLTGQDRNRNNVNPDWSPDGKTIVYPSQFLITPKAP